MTDDLGPRLLAFVRRHLGDQAIDFAARPRPATGAAFSAVFRFELSGSTDPWDGELVLRLLPTASPPGQARLEAALQTGASESGFPAPRALIVVEDVSVLGGSFIVMPHLPGRPVLRGTRWDRFARDFPPLVARWPAIAAGAAQRLHRLDPTPALRAAQAHGLSQEDVSTRRHVRFVLDRLERFGGPGLAEARSWLRENEPPLPSALSVVHGDLWPGNVLMRDGQLSGLVDWDRAAVGDPALDVGFARAGLALMPAPFPPPPPIAQAIGAAGRSMAARLTEKYTGLGDDATTRIGYYEALRCALELAMVAQYRSSARNLDRPPWDRSVNDLARHFSSITGVATGAPPQPC